MSCTTELEKFLQDLCLIFKKNRLQFLYFFLDHYKMLALFYLCLSLLIIKLIVSTCYVFLMFLIS